MLPLDIDKATKTGVGYQAHYFTENSYKRVYNKKTPSGYVSPDEGFIQPISILTNLLHLLALFPVQTWVPSLPL